MYYPFSSILMWILAATGQHSNLRSLTYCFFTSLLRQSLNSVAILLPTSMVLMFSVQFMCQKWKGLTITHAWIALVYNLPNYFTVESQPSEFNSIELLLLGNLGKGNCACSLLPLSSFVFQHPSLHQSLVDNHLAFSSLAAIFLRIFWTDKSTLLTDFGCRQQQHYPWL